MASLFLLAALHVLKGSVSPDGDRMWPHETVSGQPLWRPDSHTAAKTLRITEYTRFFS